MDRGIIEVDPRHTMRRMKTAIQGNVIRALVELITNSDDSYIRLEDEDPAGSRERRIEIIYDKEGHCGLFSIRDYAEGMSIDDVRSGFKRYGAATSGMKAGKRVRGYFGQGAKDALASMLDGRICSFRNGLYTDCRLFTQDGKPMYEIADPVPATPELRKRHGIPDNGTVASFKADPQQTGRVPHFDTVHEELANNYLLRKIMSNPGRQVLLFDDKGKSRPLRKPMPPGKEVLSEHFTVPFGSYGEFPVHISISRADVELSQTGDDRSGGLLLVDGEDAVLGISLFRYDSEPLAARLFGEVRIERFRELLEGEETVLSEERDGLVARHPFCQLLIPEIEKRILAVVQQERLRQQREERSKLDAKEQDRYKKAFAVLNKIAEDEVKDEINLGGRHTEEEQPPPNGFCLYPSSAQITVGKRYAFELRVSAGLVRSAPIAKVVCSHPRIRVLTPEVRFEPHNATQVLSKYITVEGTEPNVDGTLRASLGDRVSEASIYVAPEKDLLLSEGMVFQPETVILRPNHPRKVYLLVYIKMICGGSNITVTSDNESIKVLPEQIIVNEAEALRHVAKYELEVWGEGDGQDAMIEAAFEDYRALLEARVRSKPDGDGDGRAGMFSEPEFNTEELQPLQRTSYSDQTGKVTMYVNFPTIRHYLGDDCRFRKSLPAQVLVADLVAERCFYEIAKKKVAGKSVLRPEALPDRIQRDSLELSKKYGKTVHEALVEQPLLQEAQRSPAA